MSPPARPTARPATHPAARLPMPAGRRVVGHLGRWGRQPLALLEEGASLGPVFGLRLWRPTVVGYSPDWNRFVLGDLELFRSRGSMSGLSPHLAAGVVQTDAPEHRQRRAALEPAVRPALDRARCGRGSARWPTGRCPTGEFDAVAWSAEVVAADPVGHLLRRPAARTAAGGVPAAAGQPRCPGRCCAVRCCSPG